jgi:hypothetical protein
MKKGMISTLKPWPAWKYIFQAHQKVVNGRELMFKRARAVQILMQHNQGVTG